MCIVTIEVIRTVEREEKDVAERRVTDRSSTIPSPVGPTKPKSPPTETPTATGTSTPPPTRQAPVSPSQHLNTPAPANWSRRDSERRLIDCTRPRELKHTQRRSTSSSCSQANVVRVRVGPQPSCSLFQKVPNSQCVAKPSSSVLLLIRSHRVLSRICVRPSLS